MATIKWYKVKFRVGSKIYEEDISVLSDTYPIAEINSDLDDRFYWEEWEVLEYERIPTPDDMKIPGMDEYYEWENQNILAYNLLSKWI